MDFSSVQQEARYWLANITQSFGQNGETGVDIGLPYHTPVYSLTGGTVLGRQDQYGGGGVTSIGLDPTHSIYYQHMADIVVNVGQKINPGQLIGYSGGQLGYGDNPSSTRFSSGPHIEVGINAPFGGAWHPLGANVNPLGFLQGIAGGTGNGPTTANAGTGPSDTSGGSSSGGGFTWNGFLAGLNYGLTHPLNALTVAAGGDPKSAAFTDPTQALGASLSQGLLGQVGQWGQRAGFFLLAVLVVLLGAWLLIEPEAKAAAGDAAKVAAVAA